jgi:hypothetical protein
MALKKDTHLDLDGGLVSGLGDGFGSSVVPSTASFVAATSTKNTSTSFALTLPSNSEGDTLVVCIAALDNDIINEPGTGYTLQSSFDGFSRDFEIWTKTAEAAETSVTITSSDTDYKFVLALSYTSTVSVTAAPVGTFDGGLTGTSGTWTDDSGIAVVCFFADYAGSIDVSVAPVGMTERKREELDSASDSIWIVYELAMDSRGTIDKDITWSNDPILSYSMGVEIR